MQIIMLDVRYHKSDISKVKREGDSRKRYVPSEDPGLTMLGEKQWKWLERELNNEAQIRLICSGIQVLNSPTGGETWGNMPIEVRRLTDLIKKTEAEGVILLSGDAHKALISHSKVEGVYTLYDFTSSGMTHAGVRLSSSNKNRVEGMGYEGINYGSIQIDWKGNETQISLQALDVNGETQFEKVIQLQELRFK